MEQSLNGVVQKTQGPNNENYSPAKSDVIPQNMTVHTEKQSNLGTILWIIGSLFACLALNSFISDKMIGYEIKILKLENEKLFNQYIAPVHERLDSLESDKRNSIDKKDK